MKSEKNYEMSNLQSRYLFFHASVNPFTLKSLGHKSFESIVPSSFNSHPNSHIFHQCSNFGNAGNWLIAFY